MHYLREQDPEIYEYIVQEEQRQHEKIRLIASENYTSRAVMEATGSALTNKYSEGYPGKRYYEGQQLIDKVEAKAIERAKTLFGADGFFSGSSSGSEPACSVATSRADTGRPMAAPKGAQSTVSEEGRKQPALWSMPCRRISGRG